MTNIMQVPGELNITTTPSDDLSIALDFSIDLTGATFSAKVDRAGTLMAITVTETNLAAGQITLSISKATLTALGVGNDKWYIDITQNAKTRRYLAGKFTIENYPK